MLSLLCIIFLISILLLLLKQKIVELLFNNFSEDNSNSFAKQYFYINLYSALPKDYSFVTRIKSTDLDSYMPSLKLEENNDLNRMLQDNNTGFVVFNNNLSMACLIKFEQMDINTLREESLKDLTTKLNIPCFVFKDSEKYDFKEIVHFLESETA